MYGELPQIFRYLFVPQIFRYLFVPQTALTFLDLSNIEDAERLNVLDFLSFEDPFLQLQWASTRRPRNSPHEKTGPNVNNTNMIDPTLREYFLNYTVDARTISLQPRGLTNRSNYCYLNSILQALLACSPVYNLLSGLAEVNDVVKDKSISTPIIDGLCRLVREFKPLSANRQRNLKKKNKKKRRGGGGGDNNNNNCRRQQQQQTTTNNNIIKIDCDPSFEPFWMHKMLNGTRSDSFVVEGRQEDAEEFLGCLLNGLNDEISKLMDMSVAEGGKTRTRTPITDIFGGLLKSEIHRVDEGSTFNVQPFFTLQLNIKKARTVQEALDALIMKNNLKGVTSSKTNGKIEAWQQVKMEKLPSILILHLQCFEFKREGCVKIVKPLEYPVHLKIDQRVLSESASESEPHQYKLFAVNSHVGEEADRGHYITDTFNAAYNSWLRHDDGSVKPISEEQMLHPQEDSQMPYLLFYKRKF